MTRDGVYAVSAPDGQVDIVVETEKAMDLFIEHLGGQIGWIDGGHIDPPYIFHRAPTGFGDDEGFFKEYDAFLDEIKAGKMDLYHWGLTVISSVYGMTVVAATYPELVRLYDILEANREAFAAPYVMKIN